jgi:hypothetical protein
MFLTEKQIKDYQDDGVIIIKNIFKDWIEPLRKGFQKVLDNPVNMDERMLMIIMVDFLKIIVIGKE